MTFLELHNQVLRRLRENDITASQINSDPHLRVIGAAINDAKDAVENAWAWSALRGEDTIILAADQSLVILPDSADNHYIIFDVKNSTQEYVLRQMTTAWMREQYISTPDSGTPRDWAWCSNDAATGNAQLRIYPPSAATDTLTVCRAKHQDLLVNHDDDLLVPSLPVYSLATALASRERGELGGTPVSELFAIADAHLSDAIALDANRYPEENTWYVGQWDHETNVRYF